MGTSIGLCQWLYSLGAVLHGGIALSYSPSGPETARLLLPDGDEAYPALEKYAAKGSRVDVRTSEGRSYDALTGATVAWKASGYKEAQLPAVLTELRKVVAGRAADYGSRGGTAIPQAEFMRAGLKALRKYDPSHGAQASTYVVSSLREAQRPLLQRATPIRVPDARLQQVGKVRSAVRALLDDGGQPTDAAISRKSGVPVSVVRLLNKEVRPIHMQTREEVASGSRPSKLHEVWGLLRPELTKQEAAVYDVLRSNPQATNGEIAKIVGIAPTQVSRYRGTMRSKVEKHVRSF